MTPTFLTVGEIGFESLGTTIVSGVAVCLRELFDRALKLPGAVIVKVKGEV